MLIDDSTPGPAPGRAPVEPNWRLWGWLAVALLLGVTAAQVTGVVAYVLLCATLAAVCKAATAGVPDGGGLRDYVQ